MYANEASGQRRPISALLIPVVVAFSETALDILHPSCQFEGGTPPRALGVRGATMFAQATKHGSADASSTKHKLAMTHEERLEAAGRLREEGNARFRAGDVLGAEHKYARASAYFTVMSAESPLDPRPAAQNAEATAAAAPVYNNLALCLSRRGAWAEAAEACTELLDLRPDDRKALLRRARARVERELLDEAESDLARVVALGPASEHVRAFARDVRARLADARRGRDARDARALAGCFDRLNARRPSPDSDDLEAVDGDIGPLGLYDDADVAAPGVAFPFAGARKDHPVLVHDLDAEIADAEAEERRRRLGERQDAYNAALRSGAMRLLHPSYD